MIKKTAKIPTNSGIIFGDFIVVIFFIASLGLSVFGVYLYRLTFIQPKHLILPMLFSGILFALVVLIFKTSWHKGWTIGEGIIGGACIAYFTILYINSEFRDKESITEEFAILKTGNLAKGSKGNCGSPYATIDFWGIEKDLVFLCEYEKTLKKYTKVELTYSKGKFGFDVIVRQMPKFY